VKSFGCLFVVRQAAQPAIVVDDHQIAGMRRDDFDIAADKELELFEREDVVRRSGMHFRDRAVRFEQYAISGFPLQGANGRDFHQLKDGIAVRAYAPC
jgi:hypothetical protein